MFGIDNSVSISFLFNLPVCSGIINSIICMTCKYSCKQTNAQIVGILQGMSAQGQCFPTFFVSYGPRSNISKV